MVGARKLDEAQYPDEGGMCFIIKNSWGKGWGINGFSCMTLAYFNAWRFEDGFPRVKDVEIDTNRISEAKTKVTTKPDNLVEPKDETKKNSAQKHGKKRGSITFLVEQNNLKLTSNTMELGFLLADNNQIYPRGIVYD